MGEGTMKKISASVIIASFAFWTVVVSAQSITVTVNGTTGPWSWVNGGLNTAYQYSYGSDFTAPTVISSANGFSFSVGNGLTISYLSGDVEIGIGSLPFDAKGDPRNALNNQEGAYPAGPSYYMDPSTYPINAGELVGTFANSGGQIVGTPFAIGDSGTFPVPAGATQLQLGVNDSDYYDNSGSFSIQVTETVPEPTTMALILMSFAGFGLVVARKRRGQCA
jgi:hypothetical protein